MKKHRNSKLQLNRETLRAIDTQHAVRVAGGVCSSAIAGHMTFNAAEPSFPPMHCCLAHWGEMNTVPKQA